MMKEMVAKEVQEILARVDVSKLRQE
jgi:hypothetical protein